MSSTSSPTIMELSFPSELGYEKIAGAAVAAFALRMGFSNERIEDLKTAFCEACINAIEHGNMMRPGLRIDVTCSYEDGRLWIEVYDQGVAPVHEPNGARSLSERVAGLSRLRGHGLMLIARLTDEAGFLHNHARGNCFRLMMYRQPQIVAQS